MEPNTRLVSHLPVDRLWRGNSDLAEAECLGYVGVAEVRELVQRGAFWFVVADVGQPLQWIAPSACRDFWRHEVASRLADLDENADGDPFSGGHVYLAQHWTVAGGDVVVLQRYH